MDVSRKWYCSCTGKKIELRFEPGLDDEDIGEPTCERCGATPSSDPKKTLSYKDVEDWEN